jgi:hypothetical protein
MNGTRAARADSRSALSTGKTKIEVGRFEMQKFKVVVRVANGETAVASDEGMAQAQSRAPSGRNKCNLQYFASASICIEEEW